MIQAYGTMYTTHMHVVFRYPGDKCMTIDLQGDDQVKLAERAKKMMYMENRQYIIKKLTGWLKQRMYAFQLTDRPKCNQDAAKLIIMLGYYHNSSFFKMCDMVADYRHAVEALAPSPASSHFGAYEKYILPILDFCTEMKGDLK